MILMSVIAAIFPLSSLFDFLFSLFTTISSGKEENNSCFDPHFSQNVEFCFLTLARIHYLLSHMVLSPKIMKGDIII